MGQAKKALSLEWFEKKSLVKWLLIIYLRWHPHDPRLHILVRKKELEEDVAEAGECLDFSPLGSRVRFSVEYIHAQV